MNGGGRYSAVFGDGIGICMPYLQTESVVNTIIQLYKDETLLEKYSKKGLNKDSIRSKKAITLLTIPKI